MYKLLRVPQCIEMFRLDMSGLWLREQLVDELPCQSVHVVIAI